MAMRRRTAGFTLLEILIGALIFFVVLAAVYVLQQDSMNTYAQAEDAAALQQAARLALDRMAQELRMAGYSSVNTATPLCDPNQAMPPTSKLAIPVCIATN